MEESSAHKTGRQPASGWVKVWKVLSSPFLAVVLILVLVVLSIIGAIVIQVPTEYKIDAATYSAWLQNVAKPQSGIWYPILKSLNLFDVFHSLWFSTTGALLIASIIICSLNRLKYTRANIAFSRIIKTESFYKTDKTIGKSSKLNYSAETAGLLPDLLKKRRYKVQIENNSGGLFLAADKNRFSPLGTYLVHMSIILFITGYLIGSIMGFKDNSFIVPEGATRDIGYGTELALQLRSFSDEYWSDGSPKNYSSDVTVYADQQPVVDGTVQVNHPLSYGGVRIYQSFFGPAANIRISNTDNGQAMYEGNIAMDRTITQHPYQRPSGGFRLVQEGIIIYFVGRASNTEDKDLGAGQLGIEIYNSNSSVPIVSSRLDKGVPYQSENLEITYLGDARFSGFQISSDPGNALVWAASCLFLLGLLVVFYFPRRRIWAYLPPDTGKGRHLWIKTNTTYKVEAVSELELLEKKLRR